LTISASFLKSSKSRKTEKTRVFGEIFRTPNFGEIDGKLKNGSIFQKIQNPKNCKK